MLHRRWRKQWSRGVAATLLAVCAVMSWLVDTPAVTAATAGPAEQSAAGLARAGEKALAYLKRAQAEDGGFGSGEVTAWVVMGIAANGEDPSGPEWSKKSGSPLTYLSRHPGSLKNTSDYARLLLAVAGAGGNVRSFAGRDLLGFLLASQGEDGHLGRGGEAELVNCHAWGILALTAAGAPVPRAEAARQWLEDSQNPDGGWGYARGLTSDPDDTAAVIMALRALNVPQDSAVIQGGLKYLAQVQLADGGFGYQAREGNVASDAWVLAALRRCGEDPGAPRWNNQGAGLLGHLLGLQQADGRFAYQAGNNSYPVWMTAQALWALAVPPAPEYRFKDVAVDHWCYAAIKDLAGRGVIGGYGDGTFRPERVLTRAEFATLLVYALGLQDLACAPVAGFEDVPATHWASRIMKVVVDRGLFTGKAPGRLDPDGALSGAELVVVLARAGGFTPRGATHNPSSWYGPYVSLAEEQGFIYPGFRPEAAATRAQCAYSLWAARIGK